MYFQDRHSYFYYIQSPLHSILQAIDEARPAMMNSIYMQTPTRTRPELLSPAGDYEKLVMAVRYGADAVYLAGREFGMRASAASFSDESLRQGIAFAHQNGVKVYVTCNTLPRDTELGRLPEYLSFLDEANASLGVKDYDLGTRYRIKSCQRCFSGVT